MKLLLSIIIICILGCFSASDGDGQLYFTISPDDVTVIEGLSVTLRCLAEPRGLVKYQWKVDEQPIVLSSRRSQSDGDLHITRVNHLLDSGSFVCAATHEMSGFTIESSPATINIQWIGKASVQLLQPKHSPHIRPGVKVELRCHVDGSGDLKYEWLRNTMHLRQNSRIEMKKNRLTISEVNTDDNGMYRCLARNEAGLSTSAGNFPLIVLNNITATIKLVPQDLIVKRLERATFSCVFDNNDRVQWFFKEVGPLESDDVKTVFDNGTLIIHAAEHHDQGYYSCHGVRGKTSQIYSADLQIAYLKNFSSVGFEPALTNQLAIVAEDQELQVSCLKPDGLPAPKLFWRDPKGYIISDSGSIRVQEDTLIISHAKRPSCEGNYTCVAENLAGTREISIQVVVSWPPEILSSPQSLQVLEDESAALNCSYHAMAPPISQVRWFKDNEPIRDTGGPSRYRFLENPPNSTLLIKNVHQIDKGNYICEITNKGYPPIKSKPASLSIREKLKFSPEPVSRRLELNSTVKISCKAQGLSTPTIKWTKHNLKGEFPKRLQDVNGTLHFIGVQEEDKGNYTCTATNSQGSISHTIKIDVVIAPKFVVRPQDTTAIEGMEVVLHCVSEGDPKPTIQWDKNSRMNNLNDVRFSTLPNGSLYIKEVYLSDEGSYGCTAGNSGGLKREELYLTVKASEEGYHANMELESAEEDSMMTKTITITVCAATAYMVLVIGLMLYCRYRRRRRKQQFLIEQQKTETGNEIQEQQSELKDERRQGCENTINHDKKKNNEAKARQSDGNETMHSQSSHHSRRSKSSYDKLHFSRNQLTELLQLGRGDFGPVYRSSYQKESPSSTSKETFAVMVKELANTKDEYTQQEYKRQLDFFIKLDHGNVAKLVGLCKEAQTEYMILEYTDWGDLKQFLLSSDDKSNDKKFKAQKLTVPQVLSLAVQLAQGLKHIADHRLVHKDIAARNCLISSNFTVKISMGCMSKEPYSQEYTKYRNQIIPLRWMPKEAVYEDEYSTKSDVYSYSCLIWEIFHQGEFPFKKMKDETVLHQMKSQQLTWKAHKIAPPTLQEIQNSCWSYNPGDRPTFADIVEKLNEIHIETSKL